MSIKEFGISCPTYGLEIYHFQYSGCFRFNLGGISFVLRTLQDPDFPTTLIYSPLAVEHEHVSGRLYTQNTGNKATINVFAGKFGLILREKNCQDAEVRIEGINKNVFEFPRRRKQIR